MRKEFEVPKINRGSIRKFQTPTKARFGQRLVSIPKSDLESLEATIETLENKYVMEHLEKSEEDVQEGRVRNIDEFIKELKKENKP